MSSRSSDLAAAVACAVLILVGHRSAVTAEPAPDAAASSRVESGTGEGSDGEGLAATPGESTWNAVAAVGGAATLLPAACMPADPTELLALTALEEPASRRYGARTEAPIALPSDQALTALVESAGGAAYAASLELIRTVYPDVAAPAADWPDGCDPTVVAWAAGWAASPREDWTRIRDGIDALFATSHVSAPLVRRAAVHWYLDTRPTAITRLADLSDQSSAGDHEVIMLRALAAGASGDGEAMRSAARRIPDSPDPYSLWVRAEAARQTGRHETALTLADRALAEDAYFFAAWLTRTSVLIALDRIDDALVDLAFLERAFDGVEAYQGWLDRLASRLR